MCTLQEGLDEKLKKRLVLQPIKYIDFERKRGGVGMMVPDAACNQTEKDSEVIELSFLSGSREGETQRIDSQGSYRFGRDVECEIQLSDPAVSHFHGQLKWDGKIITVEDFGSTNGVFLNNKKIQCFKVESGDIIKVGTCLFSIKKIKRM